MSSSLKDKLHGQASINTMPQAIHYSNESIKYKIIKRNLVVFVGITNVANILVKFPEFKDLLKEIEPCYDIPGRGVVQKEVLLH